MSRSSRGGRPPSQGTDPNGPKDLVFEIAGTIQSPHEGAELVAASLSFDERPMTVWKTGASYMILYGTDVDRVLSLAMMDPQLRFIQPLPDSRILVCSSRANRETPNAWILSAGGTLETASHIGDAVSHVLTTSEGSIWVGYFDEGALRGEGLARHGIVRFDSNLTPDWTYPAPNPYGPIYDCYSLNVHGETAMAYYYRDFPIVSISGGDVSGWVGAPRGAHGLLRSGDSVLLFGGYEAEHERVVRLKLMTDGQVSDQGRGQIAGLPSGQPRFALCRGPDAHVFAGGRWYRASM